MSSMSKSSEIPAVDIIVNFPDALPDAIIESDPSRQLIFGYKIPKDDGSFVARGFVAKDGTVHNYNNGIDEPYSAPQEIDPGRIFNDPERDSLAKQCVALALGLGLIEAESDSQIAS